MVSWAIKSAVFFSLSLTYVWGGWFFVLPPLPWLQTPNLCPAWVWGGGGGSMAFLPLKYTLGSLLPLVPLPPVSAVSPLKVEQFS